MENSSEIRTVCWFHWQSGGSSFYWPLPPVVPWMCCAVDVKHWSLILTWGGPLTARGRHHLSCSRTEYTVKLEDGQQHTGAKGSEEQEQNTTVVPFYNLRVHRSSNLPQQLSSRAGGRVCIMLLERTRRRSGISLFLCQQFFFSAVSQNVLWTADTDSASASFWRGASTGTASGCCPRKISTWSEYYFPESFLGWPNHIAMKKESLSNRVLRSLGRISWKLIMEDFLETSPWDLLWCLILLGWKAPSSCRWLIATIGRVFEIKRSGLPMCAYLHSDPALLWCFPIQGLIRANPA